MSGWYAALAQGLSNTTMSGINAFTSNRNVKKQIAAQREENQKTREYNLMLAQMQNAWNQEQWERENEYNSPVNQMARYEEAGLNPDLMYQNGNSGNSAQLSGGLTAGAPATPQDFSALGQKKTIGDVLRESLDIEMMRAQIDKVKAETRSEGFQGDILKSDAAFRDAINKGTLDMNHCQILLGNSERVLNNEQSNKLRKECVKLDAEITQIYKNVEHISASIRNLNVNTSMALVDMGIKRTESRFRIKNLESITNLNNAQCNRIVALLSAEVLGLDLANQKTQQDIELMQKLGVRYDAENQRIEFDNSQAEQWDDIERGFSLVTNVVDAIANVTGWFAAAKNLPELLKKVGASKEEIKSVGPSSVGVPYN